MEWWRVSCGFCCVLFPIYVQKNVVYTVHLVLWFYFLVYLSFLRLLLSVYCLSVSLLCFNFFLILMSVLHVVSLSEFLFMKGSIEINHIFNFSYFLVITIIKQISCRNIKESDSFWLNSLNLARAVACFPRFLRHFQKASHLSVLFFRDFQS